MNIYNDLREGDVNGWSEAVKRLCKPQEYALSVQEQDLQTKKYH